MKSGAARGRRTTAHVVYVARSRGLVMLTLLIALMLLSVALMGALDVWIAVS